MFLLAVGCRLLSNDSWLLNVDSRLSLTFSICRCPALLSKTQVYGREIGRMGNAAKLTAVQRLSLFGKISCLSAALFSREKLAPLHIPALRQSHR
jgi:hypothetical protein